MPREKRDVLADDRQKPTQLFEQGSVPLHLLVSVYIFATCGGVLR